MDLLSGITRALELRWDFLFRIAASIAGLMLIAGLLTGRSPVDATETVLGWLGLEDASRGARTMQQWIAGRAEVLRWVGLVAVLLGVVTTSYRSRGAGLAVIGAALCIACGDVTPLWIFVTLLALGVAAWAYDAHFAPGPFGVSDGVSRWFTATLAQIPTAIFYIPAAPLLWIVNPRPFRI